jgi:polar amino acid transport system substrate-binding protein
MDRGPGGPGKFAQSMLFLLAGVTAPSLSAQTVITPEEMAAALAPTGTFRAAILGDNPSLGRVDSKTGEVVGPVADLIKEWSHRMKVPYAIIRATGGRDVMDRLKAHTADIGFLAPNAARAQEVDFSAPWMMMPNSYLVRNDSPLQKTADADTAGILIAAVKADTQEVYLSANLKNAKVKPLPSLPSFEDIQKMLAGGEVAAFSSNRQRLLDIAERFPTLRVLPDNFSVAPQSVAVNKGEQAKMDAVNHFFEELLATDFVKDSIDRAGLKGVEAAEPQGH